MQSQEKMFYSFVVLYVKSLLPVCAVLRLVFKDKIMLLTIQKKSSDINDVNVRDKRMSLRIQKKSSSCMLIINKWHKKDLCFYRKKVSYSQQILEVWS